MLVPIFLSPPLSLSPSLSVATYLPMSLLFGEKIADRFLPGGE